jgi:hypothetical protein
MLLILKKSASTVTASLSETGVEPPTETYSSSAVYEYQAVADIQNSIGVMNQLLLHTFRESIFT